jgi:predicted DNA-binding transcriptional regulator AlpA
VTNIEPVLLSAAVAAKMLGVSRSFFYGLHAAGKVPLPIHLGRRTLWRRAELVDWTAAGCPTRERWTWTPR